MTEASEHFVSIRCWIALTFFALASAASAIASPIRILMIGNSYTQGNSNAPATYLELQAFFDADPSIDAAITNESFGGATLFSHASSDSDAVAEIMASAGEYDVVVLQERSDRPGIAMKFGGTQLSRLNAGTPVLINDYLRVYQPQAEVILFETWARHPDLEPVDDDDLATFFNDDPAEMQSFTTLGYEHLLTDSPEGDLTDIARIAPVGTAWKGWYETYGYQNPAIGLHDDDGSHQNDLGAYLAAAVLFESIAGKSSVGNGYLGEAGGTPISGSIATLLQQQATATIGSSTPLAGDFNMDGVVNTADYTVWRDALGTMFPPGDYNVWASNFGVTAPTTSTSVPEPTADFLLMIAVTVGQQRRN